MSYCSDIGVGFVRDSSTLMVAQYFKRVWSELKVCLPMSYCSGIGVGFVRDSSTLMVAQYFKRKRELVEVKPSWYKLVLNVQEAMSISEKWFVICRGLIMAWQGVSKCLRWSQNLEDQSCSVEPIDEIFGPLARTLRMYIDPSTLLNLNFAEQLFVYFLCYLWV